MSKMSVSQIQNMAEGEGFEPPVTCATTVFKTALTPATARGAPLSDASSILRPPRSKAARLAALSALLLRSSSRLVADLIPGVRDRRIIRRRVAEIRT